MNRRCLVYKIMQSDYSESVYSETEIDTDVETDIGSESGCTYLSIEEALETMAKYLQEFCEEVDTVHSTIQTMEKPVTSVALAAFSQPRVLESAVFRKERFRLKETAKTLLDCKHVNTTFGGLCSHIRAYLFANKLVDSVGRVQLNEEFQKLLGTEDSSVSFLWILQHLHCFVE